MNKFTFYNHETNKPEFIKGIPLDILAAVLWEYETRENSMTFGETLAMVRKKSGMTQLDLRNELHCSQSAVAAWENDKRIPSITVVCQLSELFDTDKLINAYERYDDKKHSANKLRITKLKRQLEKELK